MADTQKLVTKQFGVDNAGNFIMTVDDSTASYYVFTGKHTPYTPNDAIIEVPQDSVQGTVVDMYNEMVFGKKINSSDVSQMVARHDWETGTVYEMYDHADGELFTKNFFACVNAGSQFHVYKCLDNAGGANSTVEPIGTDVNPIYSPVDGYTWKYMYTIPDSTFRKFETSNNIPVVVNAAAVAAATPGTIEVIKVEDGGAGYNNYFTSSFRLGDIRVNGQETVYALREEASGDLGYYQGCVMKITSGPAADEYRIIDDYNIVDGRKIVFLDSPFTNTPRPTDTYEIYPFVYVFGDGTQTANCMARAIVDPNASNSISRVEILDPGADYRAAVAVVDIMEIVGVTANCSLRPIISPPGGHGANPAQELGADRVCISVRFANTEGGSIPATNDYRTVGIIKDPLFQNVVVKYKTGNTVGTFFTGEDVYQFRDIVLAGTVSTTANVATVTGTGTYFDTSIVPGDWIEITNGSQNFFSRVLNVVSNTEFNCTTNVPFAFSGAKIALVEAVPQGEIVATATGELTLSNLSTKGMMVGNPKLFGALSYTTTYIDTEADVPVSIQGDELNGNYETFVQLNKFVGELATPTPFNQDETVIQASLVSFTQPNAKMHSFITNTGDDIMYVSDVNNIFMTNTEISGATSDAVFNLDNKYPGYLVKDSGKVLYIENVDPIQRQSNRSETIKIILEF